MMASCNTVKPSASNAPINIKEIVKDPESAIVDVRVAEQFSEGSVNKAVNIPLSSINDELDFFKKQKNTVIFCNTGRQASEAMEILRKNGIKNIYYGKTLKNVKAIQSER